MTDLKNKKNKKISILTIIFIILDISAISCLILFYGPYEKFRNWYITTSMTTMNHQYLAHIFYNDKIINSVLENNYIIESNNNTDISLIDIVEKTNYEDEYDKQILVRDKDTKYKLIEISEEGFNGYLVAIYDPSKIKVVTSKYLGTKGQYLIDMAKENKALVAINGGGFVDVDGLGNGGSAVGLIIENGEIKNTNYSGRQNGGVIGFTNDNKLYLGKINAKKALEIGIRDAVEFGPFLIVNGEPSFIKGNGGYGIHPRTAIGQRKDGIVLFLVIDGRSISSLGADLDDVTDIMLRYKAYNAANLDGGNSSALIIKNKMINHPYNWDNREETRPIPSGFVVVE